MTAIEARTSPPPTASLGSFGAWMFQTLAREAERSELAQGTTLFRQGDREPVAYLIFEGALDVFVTIGNKSTQVATLREGEVVGEMGALCGAPRSATVIARSPAIIGAVTRARFEAIIRSGDKVGLALIERLAERVQSATDSLACLTAAAQALESDEEDASVLSAIRRRAEELGPLAQAFERMVLEILAKRRHREDMEIAQAIQLTILPRLPDRNEDRTMLDMGAIAQPAQLVGGDFYDVFQVDEQFYALVIAGVSGKGVAAALFMAIARTMIRTISINEREALGSLERANCLLCEEHATGMHASAFFGLLHGPTGKLRYCNAGHPWPFVIAPNDNGSSEATVRALPGSDGMALGIMTGASYKTQEIDLKPGSSLFLFTSGVIQAGSESGEIYGVNRLGDLLAKNAKETPSELVRKVVGDVNRFAGTNKLVDDMACLALTWNGIQNGQGKG